jgi:hypothetical protein
MPVVAGQELAAEEIDAVGSARAVSYERAVRVVSEGGGGGRRLGVAFGTKLTLDLCAR